MTEPEDTSREPSPEGVPQPRPGRVSRIAAAILAVCFFLPMVRSCDVEYSPAVLTGDYLESVAEGVAVGDGDDWSLMLTFVAAVDMPHVFAVAVVLSSLLVVRRPNVRKWVFLTLCALALLVPGLLFVEADPWVRVSWGFLVASATLGLVALVVSRRHSLSIQAFAQLSGALGGLVWFGVFIVASTVEPDSDDELLYGMFVAFFSALVLLVGSILDLRAAARVLGGYFPATPAAKPSGPPRG